MGAFRECINMVAAAIGLIPTPRPNVIMQPVCLTIILYYIM